MDFLRLGVQFKNSMEINESEILEKIRKSVLRCKASDKPEEKDNKLTKAEAFEDILSESERFTSAKRSSDLSRHLSFARRNMNKEGDPDSQGDLTDVLQRDIPRILKDLPEIPVEIDVKRLDREILNSLPREVEKNLRETENCIESSLLIASLAMCGRTIESAIDYICEQRNIDTTFKTNGKEKDWSIGSYLDWAKSNLDIPKSLHEDLDRIVRSRHLSAHHQDGYYPSVERVQNSYGTVKEIMRLFVEKDYFQ